ncbi:hypothetical protein [Nonomuraea soli]|uniref:Uncharacterized protein n=1 Tax=Nonomuraea soli TaxID=1032476 RepID=A0A7W0CM13_9ACTN|nr:hypothetical protein [Nonomuraea soli]MBA2893628.1 hypothetical protein [Nonomuraea soli]
MTAGTTGSSDVEKFDPDATGEIPRIDADLATPADLAEEAADEPDPSETTAVIDLRALNEAVQEAERAEQGGRAELGAEAEDLEDTEDTESEDAGSEDTGPEDAGSDDDAGSRETDDEDTTPRAMVAPAAKTAPDADGADADTAPGGATVDGAAADKPASGGAAASGAAASGAASDEAASGKAAHEVADGFDDGGEEDTELTRPGRLPSAAVVVEDDEPDTGATVTHRIRPSASVHIGQPPTVEGASDTVTVRAPHAIPGLPAVPEEDGAEPVDAPGTGVAPKSAAAETVAPDAVAPGAATARSAASTTTDPSSAAAKAAAASPVAVPRKTAVQQVAARPGRMAAIMQAAPSWLPAVLMIEGLVMYILALKLDPGPLRGVRPQDIDGLGLISALPLSAFAAILILIVSFFITVNQSVDRKFLLLFQIAAITFALHGAGSLVADEPRFPTAYVHAGFVDFINRTGESSINIDARMGWPGFFVLFAFVARTAGITDLTTILQWTPLVMNLLYLLPFVLILRQVVATTRARWYAALLFVIVQWIAQDYFSPQGFTFAIYLVFVAVLLRWFGKVEPRVRPLPKKRGLRRLLAKLDAMTPGELANTGTYRADRLLMLLMLIALFVAAVASHQITPFMMLGVLTAFLLFKRTKLSWALPFFFGLMVLGWISYQTVGFWAGNIDSIFGSLGRILTNLQSNTGDRIAGSDPEHALVLQVRLGILAAVLSLAAIGLLRRLRRGVFDRAALILMCVPVIALGLQSYGGEIGLRIYMFALPGACLLAAYAFFPNLPADSEDARDETIPIKRGAPRFNPRITRAISLTMALVVAMGLSMAFLVARYGNEKFERVTSGEVAAMRYIYENDKPSARVMYLVPKEGQESTPILPWAERDLEYINWNLQAAVKPDPTQIGDVVAKLKASPRNTFLVATSAQYAYLQLNEGFPADWGPRFIAALDASKDLKKVYSNKDAAVYTWANFVKGTEIPDPIPYAGQSDPSSPWTPVGLVALAVTWITLFAYELIRLNGSERAQRRRRWLLWVAVPAFVVSIAVIVERFVYIASQNG